MLKTRVIPCLTIRELRLVKSVRFREHRNIGSYISAVRVFNARDVDEMVFLDLDAYRDGIKSWLLEQIAKECFMPLTMGGGVKTCQDIALMLELGADKIALNSGALAQPTLISEAAQRFGSQCVVLSVDARRTKKGYEVFSHGGTVATGRSARKWAQQAELLGAGEIFLTSIDRDGTMEGYDVELIQKISEAVQIPVIACGGAGKLDDFVLGVKQGKASAVAAASIFQYTQITPLNAKQCLATAGIPTRI